MPARVLTLVAAIACGCGAEGPSFEQHVEVQVSPIPGVEAFIDGRLVTPEWHAEVRLYPSFEEALAAPPIRIVLRREGGDIDRRDVQPGAFCEGTTLVEDPSVESAGFPIHQEAGLVHFADPSRSCSNADGDGFGMIP